MAEKLTSIIPENRQAVLDYYTNSENGYGGYLQGRCHYGFSSETDDGPFNMEAAQIQMELLLGRTLNLSANADVLDAGCGYGTVARTLSKEFGYQITGIDLMDNRLLANSELNNSTNTRNINLVRADYHRLPFADNSFDGAYTMETFVHASDYETVLQEFLRVLKPGGSLAMFEYTIPNLDSVPYPAKQLAERVIQHTGMSSLPKFTHGAFPGILEKAGFENIDCKDISKHVYDSWFHMWKRGVGIAIKEFSRGNIGLDNIPGGAWIWPARHQLKYIVSRANKPY